jgi:uncharacterized membrane protein
MANCLNLTKVLDQAVVNDWLRFGTMLVVSRFLEIQNKGGDFTDQKWVQSSLFTLLGFTTYHLVTKNVVQINYPNANMQNAINTVLKVGTMLTVSRVLSGQPLDEAWLRSSMYTLVGFSTYDLFTYQLVPQGLSNGYQQAADAIFQMTTVFVVSRLLEEKSLEDEAWIRSSLYTIIGFISYDLVGQYVLKGMTQPVDAVPVDAVPVDAVPVDAVPVDAVPVVEAPVEEAPVEEFTGYSAYN